MANYITYTDKVGIVAKMVQINQWWDDDANEVKAKHNLNDDRITALESASSAVLWSSIQDIGDLSVLTPTAGDLIVVERSGVKGYINYSDISGGITDHSSLTNLAYASSGHTGFQPTLTEGDGVSISGSTISSNDAEIDHDGLLNYESDQHFTQEEIEITVSQISDYTANQNVFEMTLPAATDVGDRITGATLPAGWSIAASGLDLVVTHGLARRVMDCKIWYIDGTEELQLRNTSSDNGLTTTDSNTLKILSFSKVNKVLKVYINFV